MYTGVDCAGIVEDVGDDCSRSDVKPGDAVYGVCFSNNVFLSLMAAKKHTDAIAES